MYATKLQGVMGSVSLTLVDRNFHCFSLIEGKELIRSFSVSLSLASKRHGR